jgi:hypothetical protein
MRPFAGLKPYMDVPANMKQCEITQVTAQHSHVRRLMRPFAGLKPYMDVPAKNNSVK